MLCIQQDINTYFQHLFQIYHNPIKTDNNSPSFVPASDILKENTLIKQQFPKINSNMDQLFELLELGSINVIHSSSPAIFLDMLRILFLHYATKASLYLIDTSNNIDIYKILARNPEDYLGLHTLLQNINIARCFNYHQAKELITSFLEPQLIQDMKRGKNNPVCIINGFSNIFLNGETEQNLAYEQRPAWFPIYELSESLGKLKQIALQYQIPVILLIPSASLGSQKALGGTFLHHSSQIIVRLDYSGGEIILELIKHPSKNTIHTCLQESVKATKKKNDHSLIEFINKDNPIATTK